METKKIVRAAVKRNGIIITAFRHFQCIKKATEEYGWIFPVEQQEQGFVDQYGEFYTREQAKVIAKISGQIPMDFDRTLLSEDLW